MYFAHIIDAAHGQGWTSCVPSRLSGIELKMDGAFADNAVFYYISSVSIAAHV